MFSNVVAHLDRRPWSRPKNVRIKLNGNSPQLKQSASDDQRDEVDRALSRNLTEFRDFVRTR